MKAYTVNHYGKNKTLQLTDVNLPVLKPNQVLVRVHAAGINLLDSLIRNGDFKLFLPYQTPFINGHDFAGRVIEVAAGVKNFKVGDQVYARPDNFHIGAFAEYIAANESDLALMPNNLSMAEAASIPLVGLTAWQALVEIAQVKKGQKVFIQAGSGGVGTFAIQLAKHLGAYVATTTSATNHDLVKSLGADVVIDYKKEDFSQLLKNYDVVLHSNRDSKILDKSLQILKPGGILISLVGPATPEFAAELRLPWYFKLITAMLSYGVRRKAKKQNVRFSFLFMRADGKQLGKITTLMNEGVIRPVLDKVYPFEKLNEALAYVETGRSKGKVVLSVKAD